jgi:hypothetical protein
MNFKKIVAAVAAAALALSTLAFSASAADSITFPVQVQGADGSNIQKEVTITDNGDYAITVDGLSGSRFAMFNTPQLFDAAPAGFENATIALNSLTINGDIDWPVADTSAKPLYALYSDTPPEVVNFNFFNIYYEPGTIIDTTNCDVAPGSGYRFLDADGAPIEVTSLTANVTIAGIGAAEAPAATTAPATGNVPVGVIGLVAALALAGVVVSRKK